MLIDLIIMLLSTSAPVPAKPKATIPQLPTFSFRDWHAGDAYKAEDPRLKFCKVVGSGPICLLNDKRIGGVDADEAGVVFSPAGMIALSVKFPSKSSDVVEAALRERYGKPCVERIGHPQNALFEKFDNRIRVWCFRDGKGTFQSIDGNVTVSTFVFEVTDFARQHQVQDF